MLKSVHIRKGMTKLNNDTTQRKSTRKSPPMSGRNFGSYAREKHMMKEFKEEVRKETNLKKISKSLSKRQISYSAPSIN